MASMVMSKALRCFSSRKSKPDLCFSFRKSELDAPAAPVGMTAVATGSSAASCSSSSRDRTMLWEVFRHLDQDRDGRISCNELRDSFASIGEEMPVAAAIADLDSDGDRLVDFEDFVKLMEKGDGGKREEEELRKVFGMFEVVKGSGRITPTGLQRMLGAYDLDGDGELDFQEFHQMMN